MELILEWLHLVVFKGGKETNILETFLWHALTCAEVVAFLRANTLFAIIFSKPMRWLTGAGTAKLNKWGPHKLAECFDYIEAALLELSGDGSKLLQPTFDPFEEVAAEQPAFDNWREDKLRECARRST